MRPKKHLKIFLKGGLGNQLFGYFAATNLSAVSNRTSYLLLDEIDLERVSGRYSIESFDIAHNVVISHGTALEKFKTRITRKIKFSSVIFGVLQDKSRLINIRKLNSKIFTHRKSILLDGYFQDMDYFKSVNFDSSNLELKNPSEWYIAMRTEISRKSPIVIHVRLGDFLENMDSVGVLNGTYYLNAVKQITDHASREKWIFSDDIEKARAILGPHFDEKIFYVDPPIGSDPAESLSLMSASKDIVISNSTFSLWAALIGSREKSVVAPSNFFVSSEKNQFSFPTQWSVVKSEWLTK